MKKESFLFIFGSFLSILWVTLASSNFPFLKQEQQQQQFSPPSSISTSPRSPRERKSKSPRSCNPTPIPDGSEDQEELPEAKRSKFVSFNEEYSFGSRDFLDDTELTPPKNTKFAELEESPQSVLFQFSTISKPHSILKNRSNVLNKYKTTILLFKNGKDSEIVDFYDQGLQLGVTDPAIDGMLKELLETGQNSKLKIISNRDKFKMLRFVLKSRNSTEISSLDVLELAQLVFETQEDLILELQAISAKNTNSHALRAAFFLNLVKFDTSAVYKAFIDLIEESHDPVSLSIAKHLLNQYNNNCNDSSIASDVDTSDSAAITSSGNSSSRSTTAATNEPLLIHCVKNYSEEDLLAILAFDPTEIDRLDVNDYSAYFHAAKEINLGVLEALKGFFGRREYFAGLNPLIGAALAFNSDSLKFFLKDYPEYFKFTEKDLEDAAFSSASVGNFGVLKFLLDNSSLDLYCHRGPNTLLSVALNSGQIGFAYLLIERLKFNINFVGQDSINPDGHALVFVLDKLSTVEKFLKWGANRNIRIPVKSNNDHNSKFDYFHLTEYLEKFGNEKLSKLFNKF